MVASPSDLLAVVMGDVRLVRTSSKEWHGACPLCGQGQDRFWVNTETQHWFCRQCDPRGGDLLSYVMKRDRLSYLEAKEKVGTYTSSSVLSCVDLERADAPTHTWRVRAREWVASWQAALSTPAGDRARSWLAARGLRDITIEAAQIGFCAKDEPTLGWHRGITIPLIGVDGELYGVKVRRGVRPGHPEDGPKYIGIRGGHHALYGRTQSGIASGVLLIVEGEFDALLALQELGHLVDVATIGLGRPEGRWLHHLVGYQSVLICLDNDEAGQRGWAKWEWMGNARRVQLPAGKDITEAWQQGLDLCAWAMGLL